MIGLNYISINKLDNIVDNLLEGYKRPQIVTQLIKLYKNVFGNDWYNLCSNKSLLNTDNTYEIMRGYLGETQEQVFNSIGKFFDEVGVTDDKCELSDYGLHKKKSGEYNTVVVTFKEDTEVFDTYTGYKKTFKKDKEYYFINTYKSIHAKEFTPKEVKIAGRYWKDTNTMYNVMKGFSKLKSHKYGQAMLNVFKTLTTVMEDSKKETLDDLLETPITYNDVNFGNISKEDVGLVLVDFGEVIGGSFLLNVLRGEHTLFFPSDQSEESVDYYIDRDKVINKYGGEDDPRVVDGSVLKVESGISAKHKSGSAFSTKGMANSVLKQVETGAVVPKEVSSHFQDFVDEILPALTLREYKNKSGVIYCIDRIFNFLSKNASDDKFEQVMKCVTSNDNNCINVYNPKKLEWDLKGLERLFKNEKGRKKFYYFLSNLYEILKYDKSKLEGGFDCELFDNIEQKLGSNDYVILSPILFPIKAAIVDYINDYYEEEVNLACQLGLGFYQLNTSEVIKESEGDTICDVTFLLHKTDKVDGWKFEVGKSEKNVAQQTIPCKLHK